MSRTLLPGAADQAAWTVADTATRRLAEATVETCGGIDPGRRSASGLARHVHPLRLPRTVAGRLTSPYTSSSRLVSASARCSSAR